MSTHGHVALHRPSCWSLFVDGLRNVFIRVGWLYHENWIRAKANVHLSDAVLAVLWVASHALHLPNCIGARMGQGVPSLAPLEDVDASILVWWRTGRPQVSGCVVH